MSTSKATLPKTMTQASVNLFPNVNLRLQIRSVPTVMAYVKGSPTETFAGNIDDNALHEFLDRAEHGYE